MSLKYRVFTKRNRVAVTFFALLVSVPAYSDCFYSRATAPLFYYKQGNGGACDKPTNGSSLVYNGKSLGSGTNMVPLPVVKDGVTYTAGALVEELKGACSGGKGTYQARYYQICATNPNTAPTVDSINASTSEDHQLALILSATDPNAGDTHTFQIVSAVNPAHGSAYIAGNTLTFTPKPDWNGSTVLSYQAVDSQGAASNVATITITVTPVNDAPVAQPKSLILDEDTSGFVTLSATDIDSPEPTVFEIVSLPNSSHGSVVLNGSTLTFTPSKDWYGTTSLTYRAQDDAGAWSAPATVIITVRPINDAPVVPQAEIVIAEDSVGKLPLTAMDVDSSVFDFEIQEQPAFGFASIAGNTLTYTPPLDWFGTTTLRYRAKDDSGAWSESATITITVTPVNDPPVADPLTLTLNEDTPGTVTLKATDIDSPQDFVFELVSLPPTEIGTATLQGDHLLFSPAQDWNGTTTLTYRAKDHEGDWSTPEVVTVIVTPVNDQPTQTGNLILHTTESVPVVVRGAVTH
ncbi:Ig-like domain-containing protein [Pseudomonas aeruginosa]|uniref:Ig-like domain-containing protein n=1 Tax=Pseudomonas aeruginosa TaxID=287 RepID=UPI002B26E6AE|nr:Ig-like domain-containing protein [Pseudomonas aeruginosa]MEA8593056.1 Ig-like domain-containing protein [Pseudomonas aeruginosa]